MKSNPLRILLWGILFFCFLPHVCKSERYVTIDPDGFTYIREKPDVRSKIIGKVEWYKPFYDAYSICGHEGDYSSVPENWMPVMLDEETESVGYVYRKYIRNIYELPRVEHVWCCPCSELYPVMKNDNMSQSDYEYRLRGRSLSENCQVTFTHQQTTVLVAVKPLDSIDELPPPEGWVIGGHRSKDDFYLREITITSPDKIYTFPDDMLHRFNFINSPVRKYQSGDEYMVYTNVLIGHFGEIYIKIFGGDGAEGFSVIWSIVDGELFWEDIWRAC